MVGCRFGQLTVASLSKLYRKRSYWICLCDCGNTTEVLRHNLISGNAKSCGCSRRKYKQATINHEYNQHKQGGLKRGYGALPKNVWLGLVQKKCFYCGSIDTRNKALSCKNSRGYKNLSPDEVSRWECFLNGVDRVNNKVGYVVGNCVSCCELCNRMKASLDFNTFLEHIEKIYENRKTR